MTDSDDRSTRRTFSRGAGTTITTSTLAGCIGSNPLADSSDENDTTDTTETAAGTAEESGPVTEPAPPAVDQYLRGASFYNGDLVVGIMRIAVGAGPRDTGFDPAAIKVATGTQVTWEWASGGAPHALRSVGDGPIDSGEPREGTSVTYRQTLTRPGIHEYYCEVHRGEGAKGVVVVERGSNVGANGTG